jgi:hypothetical protein
LNVGINGVVVVSSSCTFLLLEKKGKYQRIRRGGQACRNNFSIDGSAELPREIDTAAAAASQCPPFA